MKRKIFVQLFPQGSSTALQWKSDFDLFRRCIVRKLLAQSQFEKCLNIKKKCMDNNVSDILLFSLNPPLKIILKHRKCSRQTIKFLKRN